MHDSGYKRDSFTVEKDNTTFSTSPRGYIDHLDICGLQKEWNGLSFSSQMSANLTEAEKVRIYHLFETNMRGWYEKNWGLKESEKKNELYNTESQFICVYKSTSLTGSKDVKSCNSSASVQNDTEGNEMVAFAMFRFEWDDEDEPEFPVLFCYEIQICDEYRGQKIGRHVSLERGKFFITGCSVNNWLIHDLPQMLHY